MRSFLTHWFVVSVALAATAWVLPGVVIASLPALLGSALVLGFINALLKPVLVLLTLPFTLLTLGVFYLILNGLLFGLAAALVPGFDVASFGSAVVAAIVMGFFSMFISHLVKKDQ